MLVASSPFSLSPLTPCTPSLPSQEYQLLHPVVSKHEKKIRKQLQKKEQEQQKEGTAESDEVSTQETLCRLSFI